MILGGPLILQAKGNYLEVDPRKHLQDSEKVRKGGIRSQCSIY
jgi:hypothetical protein